MSSVNTPCASSSFDSSAAASVAVGPINSGFMSAPFGDGCVGASIVAREVAGAPCLLVGRNSAALSLGHQARGFSFDSVRRVHVKNFAHASRSTPLNRLEECCAAALNSH